MRLPKSFDTESYTSFSRSLKVRSAERKRPKSPIKLSVVTQFFPPDYAATGQLIEELVRQLGQQGIDIKVFTGQPGYAFDAATAPAYEQHELVQIKRSRTTQISSHRIRGKLINGVSFAIRTMLHLIINTHRRNLVLVTTAPPFLPFLSYLVNLFFGLPYVCLLYDLYPDIATELGVLPKQHWLARFWRSINCKVWRRAKGIIVLSPNMKQRVVGHCPEAEHKIAVIHSWADPEAIVPMPKQKNWFAWRYGLINKFTVLYSGNMGRCHDIDTIFETAIQLQDEPIQFVCIGSGAKRKSLMEKVEELGLTNILFLPYQDKDVLPYSLTACDLSLVSVSPGMESLVAPSKLYPALASGRPIAAVCPDSIYLKQLIDDAKCGTTFRNGDSQGLAAFIRHLSNDRQLVEQMGRAGRHYLEENFTPEIIAEQYYQVLHQAFR
jgi:glycosyltransferase involved in cell wall biosynthesis